MSTDSLNSEKIFSKMAVKNTAVDENGKGDRSVELNDLARQVAEQFAANVASPHLISAFVRLVEFVGLLAIGLLLYLTYVWPETAIQSLYLTSSVLGSFLTICFIQAMDGYQISSLRNLLSPISKVISGFVMALTFVLLVTFFTKTANEFSRLWFGLWFVFGIGFLTLFRVVVSFYVKKLSADGRLERRAVIVGGGEPAAELIRSLESQSDNDIRICGIFDDRKDDRSPPIVAGYPKLGNVKELVKFGRMARIDTLIVSLPLSAENRVLQLLKRLWVLPVDIRLSAHTNKLRFRPRSYSYEGAVPFLDVFDKPIADWDAVTKRAFDLFFSVVALLLLFPVMIATAIAIRLESKGPVFFRQKRYGFNNQVLNIWKFRSMFHEMADAEAKTVVTKGDPRVTRVGRFIRKTSIDELPQLFNVLTGRLSLVGPRPHAVNAHTQNQLWDEVVDGYFARHKVKPGVTGWAQINGWRGEIDNEDKIKKRVSCDLYYIENWSLMLDFYILFITPAKLLNTENAY
ncbi:MAG: undecaprenyl-phosphate glucose phosphotransferase [Rhizobiaceae bacterium]|nr:undecaprenyl-phosphate glucose phosphotransferase [Rhizobiaceae bacterium]